MTDSEAIEVVLAYAASLNRAELQEERRQAARAVASAQATLDAIDAKIAALDAECHQQECGK